MGGCVACYRGGEGEGATADLNRERAALCKMEAFASFEGVQFCPRSKGVGVADMRLFRNSGQW